jgi:hypothetical protein
MKASRFDEPPGNPDGSDGQQQWFGDSHQGWRLSSGLAPTSNAGEAPASVSLEYVP